VEFEEQPPVQSLESQAYFKPPPERADEPLVEENPFRGSLRRAFAGVFLASFCGMTLELTGIRFLAPQLGVSLYSITGIIGVMLAATAAGNHVGGVLADRGVGPALRATCYVAFGLMGAFFAYAIGRWVEDHVATF